MRDDIKTLLRESRSRESMTNENSRKPLSSERFSRRRRMIREIISTLVRQGRLEIWTVDDRELDGMVEPKIVTSRVGEQIQKPNRRFLGCIFNWKF